MFGVSDGYKAAIKQKTRKSKLIGQITTSTGKVIQFSDSNIIKGSVSINNQCVNGSDFEYGAVYAAEMAVSFAADVDRYTLYDAKITASYFLDVNGIWEEVPLGVFYINEPIRKNGIITVKALDGFIFLEKSVDEEVFGTPYQLLAHVAVKCGIELSQTEEEINTMTNGSKIFTFIPDRLDTYRDAVAYVSMLLCGFAVFDRYGKLKIVNYAQEPSREMEPWQRTNASFSDFTTYFYGVKARFIAEENYAPYEFVDIDIQGGLILDVGDIPIVQGLPEFKHEIMQDIFSSLRNIRYVPCTLNYSGDPSIDLGDLIISTDVKGESVKSYVTKYNWRYRGLESLESAGGNPKLSTVKDRTSKRLDSFEADITARDIITYTYTNIKDYAIKDTETEIIVMNYSTVTNARPIFIATVPLEMDKDGVVEFQYYMDSIKMEGEKLEKYLQRGKHFLTFALYLDDNANTRHSLAVKARTVYVESDIRIQTAKTATILNFMEAVKTQNMSVVNALADETAALPITILNNILEWEEVPIDLSIPTMNIPKQGIKAMLYAQGLASASRWDGTINFQEAISMDIPTMDVSMAATVDITQHIPGRTLFAESISLDIPSMDVDFVEELVVSQVYVQDIMSVLTKELCTYDDLHVQTDNGVFELRTTYDFAGQEVTVDTGRMMRTQIITDGMQSISELGWR